MRCILLLLDGLGDRSHPALNDKTPLQAANTPNLDHVASVGFNGLFHSHLQGTALPSELAHFLMFGYPIEEFPGRGVVEALGEGLQVKEGDVALLSRIFSVTQENGTLILTHEDPKVDPESCRILHDAIASFSSEGIEVEFIPTKGIGGIVVMRGDVSSAVTDSNPITEGRPLMEVLPLTRSASDPRTIKTARVLNAYLRWCYQRLSAHPLNQKRVKDGLPPINAIGTQRAGMMGHLQPFSERWGLNALIIASGAIYHGLGQVLGMTTRRVKDSADPARDLEERLKIALEATEYDFIHVHTKVTDEAGHKKDPLFKQKVIEAVDRAVGYAVEHILADEEILFIVTADHSTAGSGTMIHTGENVPIVMAGKYVRRDAVQHFDEISCAAGGLSLVRGKELMYLVLNFLDRGKLWGLMDAPDDQPFTPGRYTSLIVESP